MTTAETSAQSTASTRKKRRLLVRQIKEWGEILSGLETKNRFEIRDENEAIAGYAAETGDGIGAMFLRSILGRCRRAEIHVTDAAGKEVAVAKKPFRWYFHRMELYEDGRLSGAVQRKFSLLNREFEVENAEGRPVLRIVSPLFHIWTFRLLFGDREVGVIRKQWTGMLREAFTDADAFGIEYDAAADLDTLRNLLLAATFLIDFTCFENNSSSFFDFLTPTE